MIHWLGRFLPTTADPCIMCTHIHVYTKLTSSEDSSASMSCRCFRSSRLDAMDLGLSNCLGPCVFWFDYIGG